MTKREYFVREAETKATASVIWLHGLGADGKDFDGIVDQLGLPKAHGVRFIFPSAPFKNITVNGGMLMRAWYDIYHLNMLQQEDAIGLEHSRLQIEQYIQSEHESGIPYNKIILAGFSQGGALSLYTALRSTHALAGVIVLSAYLPMAKEFMQLQHAHTKLPIFVAHGVFDPVVPYSLGQVSYNLLLQYNYNVEWYSYPMQHTVCFEEIAAIGTFIRRCLGYA